MRDNRIQLLLLFIFASSVEGARLKDIAAIRGVRNNQLAGYGLVVGLSGTGDKTAELTENSLGLLLKGLGVDFKSQKLETKNAAAVIVTAVLPPFSRLGSHLDVTVSSIGSASSLDGGNLLMTSLRGPDGTVYAMAQGKITTTIRKSEGSSRASGQTLVTASVPSGALLEKEVPFDFGSQHELKYQLSSPDFTTSARVAARINEEIGGKYATAEDPGTVNVVVPFNFEGSTVDFVARLESIDIEPDQVARVVINQRVGSVVMGSNVRISSVALAYGGLKFEVKDPKEAKEPNAKDAAPAAGGTKKKSVGVIEKGASIADVAASLNEMGASADDLVALLQALKASGALVAELEVQ